MPKHPEIVTFLRVAASRIRVRETASANREKAVTAAKRRHGPRLSRIAQTDADTTRRSLRGAADERSELVGRGMAPLASGVRVTRVLAFLNSRSRVQAVPTRRLPSATEANYVVLGTALTEASRELMRSNQGGRHVALPLRTRKGSEPTVDRDAPCRPND
jgi:hypothetical protein